MVPWKRNAVNDALVDR